MARKVVLAYSGGLDTSIIIPWLRENYQCEVVAVCGDIGQGDDELKGLEEKARKTGASEVHVADMLEEFVTEYLWRLVRSSRLSMQSRFSSVRKTALTKSLVT